MIQHIFRPGDPVIFRSTKRSSHPGRRAQGIMPDPNGEAYTYEVDKFWVVAGQTEGGLLLCRTRRGKSHLLHPDNPKLRKPRWWERLLYRTRFPALDSANQTDTSSPAQS